MRQKKAEELCYGKFWLIGTIALGSLYVLEVRGSVNLPSEELTDIISVLDMLF